VDSLLDRDYRRTEREITEAIAKARQASEALRTLTQDLNAFNLEHYRALRGYCTLDDLRFFVEKAIPRLGGAVLPDGEFLCIETPEVLQRYVNVATAYRDCTCDRRLAMRRRKAQLLGLGHPLVDALVAHLQSAAFQGDVSCLLRDDEGEPGLSVRLLLHLHFEDGRHEKLYKHYLVNADGSWQEAPRRFDLSAIRATPALASMIVRNEYLSQFAASLEYIMTNVEAEIRANTDGLISLRTAPIGYLGI
jgi:hypothetical protein